MDTQLYRGAKPELWRERIECEVPKCMIHQVYPYTYMLDEFDSGGLCELLDPDMEILEEQDDLSKMITQQHISSIVVNLKVSQELLQQAKKDLETVEKRLQQLGSVRELGDNSSCASSLSMSSTNLSGVSAAVAPPSKYYRCPLHTGHHGTENLEVQLVGREWELGSKEEAAEWLSHYPVEQLQYKQDWSLELFSACCNTGNLSEEAVHSTEELSQYRSALDYSLLTIVTEDKLQVRGSCDGFILISKMFINTEYRPKSY